MRAYLAAPYAAREQIRGRARDLVTIGVDVTSTWLQEETVISAGTVGAAPAVDPMSADAHVEMDLDDVRRSDVLVLFTESAVDIDPELCRSGGRHVEFGMALALDKRVLVVGEAENIFHRSHRGEVVPDWLSAVGWFMHQPEAPAPDALPRVRSGQAGQLHRLGHHGRRRDRRLRLGRGRLMPITGWALVVLLVVVVWWMLTHSDQPPTGGAA